MYVILVGCGRVGASLANALAADEHDVVVIDNNPETFRNVGAAFNGMTVTGTGIDVEVLRQAGIERADAFVAVTSLDNVNLMASQIARRIFDVPKVIARINDLPKRDVYQTFGVETISPTELGASYLRQMLEAEGVHVLRILGAGEALMVMMKVPAFLEGRPLSQLETPEKIRVASLEREGFTMIPEASTLLKAGDRVLAVVRRNGLEYLRKLVTEATPA